MLPPHSDHDEPMTGQENKNGLFYIIHFSIISNPQQKYRKGHVFSYSRTFVIKHLMCYNFLQISRIPETTSQYPTEADKGQSQNIYEIRKNVFKIRQNISNRNFFWNHC